MITRLRLPGIRHAIDFGHIEKALEAVPLVQSVTIDRQNETATVEHDGAAMEQLRAAARSVGLTVESREAVGAETGIHGRPKVILVPVDFSNVTERVVDEAAKLARMLHARVVLMHVTEPTTGVVDYAAIVVAVAQVNEAAVKFSVQRLGELERRLTDDGVEAVSVQVTGTPLSEIMEQARVVAANYIVIGSHGHTAFYDLLVGGTAHGILKRAACPVVIVPAPVEPDRAT
jgi:universal stress protein A